MDYSLRGKCKELSEAAVAADPTLTLVRGFYYCPVWGEQQHWWAQAQDGTIVDPTAAQFPSLGKGQYIPFDGTVHCANCDKSMEESSVEYADSHYAFCSYQCYGHFVM